MRLEGDIVAGGDELARLAAGEVHLWFVQPCAPGFPEAWNVGREALSASELEQLGRRIRVADQRLYLAAHATLRLVLGHYLGVEPETVDLGTGEHGKPRLDNGLAVELSLTHSAGVAAVVLGMGGPVGVDVESRTRHCRPSEIADRYFAAAESAGILNVPEPRRARRFFLYWTLKESVLKAAGTGLTAPLHSVTCCLRGRSCWSVATTPGLGPAGASWRVAALALGTRHIVAVTVARTWPATVLRSRSLLVGSEASSSIRLIGCDAESLAATTLVPGGAARVIT